MGEFVDKVKGATNKAVGNAKVAVGKGTDDPKLFAKGHAQIAKGEVQKAVGSVKGKLGNNF